MFAGDEPMLGRADGKPMFDWLTPTNLAGVSVVTATPAGAAYLRVIEFSNRRNQEHPMTKFFSLFFAAALFAPIAYATLNQAALIVA